MHNRLKQIKGFEPKRRSSSKAPGNCYPTLLSVVSWTIWFFTKASLLYVLIQNLKENLKLLFLNTWQLRCMNMKAQCRKEHQCKTTTIYLLITTDIRMPIFCCYQISVCFIICKNMCNWHVWNNLLSLLTPFIQLNTLLRWNWSLLNGAFIVCTNLQNTILPQLFF